ncbi:MAG: hypothetical protein K2X32_07960, partial [Phycisphaerales bacterium]|nr:hypothetical protein [Phycisphaerales bacterium]
MKTFACMAAALVVAASAHAQSTITLFGQQYRVDRFDYSQQVTWPSVRNPGETLGLVELEGVCYAGNNRFFGSSEAMSEVFVGPPGGLVELKNHIVEFQLLESGGIPTGLQYVRTLLTNDFGADGFELAPSGLTINAGSAGPGAGGNLVVGTSEEN